MLNQGHGYDKNFSIAWYALLRVDSRIPVSYNKPCVIGGRRRISHAHRTQEVESGTAQAVG